MKSKNTYKNILIQALEIVPVALPAITVLCGAYYLVLILAGLFSLIPIVFGSLVIIFLFVYRIVPLLQKLNKDQGLRNSSIVSFLVLFGLSVWVLFNINYTAQNIFVYRDPALYNNSASWLINNSNLELEASDVFSSDDIRGDAISLAQRDVDSGRLYVHGGQMLPALSSIFGKALGQAAIFKANIIVAAISILAFFGFCKQFIKLEWAGYATLLLSLTLPMLYFSRDSYTEPLAMMAIFSALSLINIAIDRNNKTLWLVAGVLAGSSTLVRIDAYILLASFVLFGLLRIVTNSNMRSSAATILHFMVGLFASSFLGWVAFTQIGAAYYRDLRSSFILQIILILGAVLSGVAIIYASRDKKIRSFHKKHASRLALISVIIVLISSIFLLSRPFWQTVYTAEQNPVVANIQMQNGAEVEPRAYSEQSLNWIWWYVGPVTSVFALGGLLLITHRTVIDPRKYIKHISFIMVFGLTFIIYTLKPTITPDQVWATRRFLPIVFPGVLFLSALFFQAWAHRLTKLKPVSKKALLTGLFTITLGPILFISGPFLEGRTYQGQLAHINRICSQIPDNSAVLLAGINGQNMLQAIKTYCMVPVEWVHEPTQMMLQTAQAAANEKGYQTVVITNQDDYPVLPNSPSLKVLSIIDYQDIERTLLHPPRNFANHNNVILGGTLNADGMIEPL